MNHRTIRRITLLSLIFLTLISCDNKQKNKAFPYKDLSLPIDERVEDLLSRMTVEEKISQLRYVSPAIERLGIPAYNWWNEALHFHRLLAWQQCLILLKCFR